MCLYVIVTVYIHNTCTIDMCHTIAHFERLNWSNESDLIAPIYPASSIIPSLANTLAMSDQARTGDQCNTY